MVIFYLWALNKDIKNLFTKYEDFGFSWYNNMLKVSYLHLKYSKY